MLRFVTAAALSAALMAAGGASALPADSPLDNMVKDLEGAWSPDCAPGAKEVVVGVVFRLDDKGALIDRPVSSEQNATDPTIKRASDSALAAVSKAAPFSKLPPELYGPRLRVIFNSHEACAGRAGR